MARVSSRVSEVLGKRCPALHVLVEMVAHCSLVVPLSCHCDCVGLRRPFTVSPFQALGRFGVDHTDLQKYGVGAIKSVIVSV